MWLWWARNMRISLSGADATVEQPDGTSLVLPGASALFTALRHALQAPCHEARLEGELGREIRGDWISAAIRELIDHQILIRWDTGPELVDLHRRTLQGGEDACISPSWEIGRLVRETGGSQSVPLPYPERPACSLDQALSRRRTCRAFREEGLSLRELGTVLGLASSAGGDGPPAPMVPGGPPARRPYPSGGALYPVEIVVYPAHVSGILPRFYYYQALSHRLAPLAPGLPDTEIERLLANHPVRGAAFFVLFFVDFTRPSLAKYGPKAYRLALIEAGHIAQNVLLVASSSGIAGLPLCGFMDEELSLAAGLCYPDQAVAYVLALGRPAGVSDHE
jgi:SagB-type dehydrogenase family enzyme